MTDITTRVNNIVTEKIDYTYDNNGSQLYKGNQLPPHIRFRYGLLMIRIAFWAMTISYQEGDFIKKIVVILIILFLIGGTYIYLCKSFFSDWSVDPTKTEKIIKTDLGDEFLFHYEYSDFPDSQTTINILDKKNNQEIARFIIEDKPYKSDLINLINTSKIRCYEVYNMLIYSVNNNNFDYVDIDQINENDPVEYPSLVQTCKVLVNLNEWKWIEACGQFLIKSGDNDILSRLQNYAKGQFTQEEIETNKNSKITKEDIQSFSKQLLDAE